MGEGSAGTSVWGPESQEEALESLNGPIDIAIDVLFRFFFARYFYLEK